MQKENCLLRATMQEKILIMFINIYSAKKKFINSFNARKNINKLLAL